VRLLLIALALVAIQDAKTEWATRWVKLVERAADEHSKLGEYLEMQRMHQWARLEFERAVTDDPEHAYARKQLGHSKGESGAWGPDPRAKVESENKKTGEDAKKVETEYRRRLEKSLKPLAASFVDLGNWAKSQGLDAESKQAYGKALDIDPDQAQAREALGFTKEAGRWTSGWDKLMRADFKDGIVKAPAGVEESATTAVESALGVSHLKRKSGRFLAESPYLTQGQITKCIQVAEHSVEMYKKLFSLFEDPIPAAKLPMNHILFQTREQHEAYIEKFDKRSDEIKKQVKAMSASTTADPPKGECWQGSRVEAFVYDFVIHSTVHTLSSWHIKGSRSWLREGMAYYFTRLMNDTAMVYCVRFEGTKTEGGKSMNDPNNWPAIVREWMRSGGDPDIHSVIKVSLNDLTAQRTIKAWSLIDFMFAENRGRWIEFHKELAADPKDTGEKAFLKVFQWSLEDLDARWRDFARRAY